MTLLKLGGAVFSIFAAASITDWIFSGSKLSQKYYSAYPEIWRPMEAGSAKFVEGKLLRASLFITLEFAIAFVLVYLFLRPGLLFSGVGTRALAIALGLWLLIPVPLGLTQHLFVKYHRMSTALFLAAWFVKLLLASLIMSALF